MKMIERMIEVIEKDIIKMNERGVEEGKKVLGEEMLRK